MKYKNNNFEYKKVLIFGYSNSGKSVEKVLKDLNVNYLIYDDNVNVKGGIFLAKITKQSLQNFDLIVLSPGVSIYHKAIKLAKKMNVKVVSELEFGSWFCDCKIIAITGTNGKTTVTKMLTHVLSENNINAKFFGNVGVAFSEVYFEKKLDFAVVEVSSFQLEAIHTFTPYIGVLLNIAPDHIDRHKTFKNYIECKLNMFKNGQNNTIAVLNYDDDIVRENADKIEAKRVFVSEKSEILGVCEVDDIVLNYENSNNEKMATYSKILNINTFKFNVLTVVYIASKIGLKPCEIEKSISIFKYDLHRCEFVDTVNEINFVDDSKATNIHATVFALKKYKSDVVLLLGGKDKDLDFNEFFKGLSYSVVSIYCFGEAGKKIAKSARGCKLKLPIFQYEKMQTAVENAFLNASKNQTILLSPACASFDEFSDYVHRGNVFKTIVKTLKDNQSKLL